jgi:hypothetical protein
LITGMIVLSAGANATGEDGSSLSRVVDRSRDVSTAPAAWRADQLQRRSAARPPVLGDRELLAGAVPLIMAGDPAGLPPDSPMARINPNTPDSPFRGVCSILVNFGGTSGRCSATPITDRHILTAAHCFDDDEDGTNDAGTNVTIVFNVDGDASLVIEPDGVLAVDLHPDYTGFNNPSLNDDLAIITLVDPLPDEVQVYPVFRGELADGEIVDMVGYGRSGTGVNGLSVPSSASVKRVGANAAEMFFADDEAGDTLEVWSADFDYPDVDDPNCFGGATLGNAIETSAAPGDSGGPAFIEVDGALHVWGVNTYGNGCAGLLFHFGSVSGGIVVSAYLPWIDTIIECFGNCYDCNDKRRPRRCRC